MMEKNDENRCGYKKILQTTRTHCADKLAITDGKTSLTFGELGTAVKQCQLTLSRSSETVVIRTSCRIKSIVLMLAAIEQKTAFVPVDTEKPDSIVVEILKKIGKSRMISDVDWVTGECDIEAIDYSIDSTIYSEKSFPNVMSIMFTSGTTGKPKGVLVPCSAIVNLLWKPAFFTLEKQDVFATYSPLSFDASTFEIFTPLLNGNTLIVLNKMEVIDSQTLKHRIAEFGITCLWMTAGLFNQQVKTDSYAGLRQVKKLFVGGDKVDFNAAINYLENTHAGLLFNGYGPTENTVFTTVAQLTSETLHRKGQIAIGHLIPGVDCFIQDAATQRVARYGSGKLLVKGKGLSYGYLNDKQATAEVFLSLAEDNHRYYDTGDYVRREEDGNFYFIGRKDRQVKLNGHRVELDDIEKRIGQTELFERLVCFMIGQSLVAVAQPYDNGLQADNIRNQITPLLSVHELPKHILVSDYWPLTENNKLDVKQITLWAEIEINKNLNYSHSADKEIVCIAESILQKKISSKMLRLFEIGFDSININQLQMEIANAYGVKVEIMDIYAAGTLQEIENIIKQRMTK